MKTGTKLCHLTFSLANTLMVLVITALSSAASSVVFRMIITRACTEWCIVPKFLI